MEIVLIIGVLIVAAVVVGKVVSSGSAAREARVLRQVRETPVVRIADAVDGERVKIKGEAKAKGDTVRAPLTGRAVLYWDVRSTRYHKGMLAPRTRQGGGDFLVEDASGTAIVRVEDVDLALDRDHKQTYPAMEAPDVLFETLEAAGNRFDRTVGELVGEEGVIEDGETVAVVGVVSSEGTGDARRVVISADPEFGLLLTDDSAELFELPRPDERGDE